MDRYIDIKEGPRIIVCGGRYFGEQCYDWELLCDTLSRNIPAHRVIDETTQEWPVLVHGDAAGADTLADDWADWGVLVEPHPADWAVHGRAAGPIRNQEMVEAGAVLCIAFPGGKGTADMAKRCRAAGIKVLEVSRWPVDESVPHEPHPGCRREVA